MMLASLQVLACSCRLIVRSPPESPLAGLRVGHLLLLARLKSSVVVKALPVWAFEARSLWHLGWPG